MNNSKISVITVCFNAVETIEKTILSVINQTYSNIEYIIIDGASKDGTLDVINKYRDKIACFVSEPDKGIYDAMNKATKLAHGDFLFFLNSDDTFYDDSVLERIASSITNFNTIYYGDAIMLPDGHVHGGSFNKKRLCHSNICHQTIFYPKSVFGKYVYNTNYKLYADWNLNIECMGNNNFYFSYLNEPISYYIIGGASFSHNDYSFKNDFYGIIRRNFGWRYLFYLFFLHYRFCLIKLLHRFKGDNSLDSAWTIF